MNNLAQDLQLHTIEDDNSINSSSIQSKINSFRDFFVEKTALILDNKANSLLYALWLATAVAAFDNATSIHKDQNISNQSVILSASDNHQMANKLVSIQQNNQDFAGAVISTNKKPNKPNQPVISSVSENHQISYQMNNKLGAVQKGGRIVLNKQGIYDQADKYFLDRELFYQAIENNELGSKRFLDYISVDEYNQLNLTYSYRQVWEAIWDLATIEWLIEQQYTTEEYRIKAQRIFNELLRSKQKVIVHGSQDIAKNDKYDLIHDAAGYNYTFVTWEEYNQESMWNVTRKIDNGEYDEEMLISYARELRDYIHYNAWFDMDQYDTYLASIRNVNNTSHIIAQNNSIIEEENY